MRVLILEDEPDVAEGLSTGLQMIDDDLEISHAATLLEAIAFVEQHSFDVALVDIGLPDSVDAEAIITLRQVSPRLPLVALTGTAFEDIGEDLARYGVQDYLEKGRTDLTRVHQVLHLATIRQTRENELSDQALLDPLTHALNRNGLDRAIAKAISHAERNNSITAVVLCDVDGFKRINDAHGHSMGDQVLQALASRMTELTRSGDSVARLGGDEFVAVLEGLPDQVAVDSAVRKLKKATSFDFPNDDPVIVVTASIGVAVYPDDAHSAEELLNGADQAMYRNKRYRLN